MTLTMIVQSNSSVEIKFWFIFDQMLFLISAEILDQSQKNYDMPHKTPFHMKIPFLQLTAINWHYYVSLSFVLFSVRMIFHWKFPISLSKTLKSNLNISSLGTGNLGFLMEFNCSKHINCNKRNNKCFNNLNGHLFEQSVIDSKYIKMTGLQDF